MKQITLGVISFFVIEWYFRVRLADW